MKKHIIILILTILSTSIFSQPKILPSTVIVKFNSKLKKSPQDFLSEKIKDIKSVSQAFPNIKPPKEKYDKFGHKLVDLSKIYRVQLKSAGNEIKIAVKLSSYPEVEYAEPYYLPAPLYTPNDPRISSQYNLTKLFAFDAWDIFKGNDHITVGIPDMGIDLAHEDLQNKIAYNYNDPIDGIDNDNDGYVDNFYGWDLGDNDNNPQWNEEGTDGEMQHGAWVSGIGFAETDNNLGIAGFGFNVKFLPVKISNSNGTLNRSYEGIIYAAQHGCKVVNCSWGSTYYSQYAQDSINYVTYNLGVLVVAAAGNYNNAVPFYPASYDNVISVAASNPNNEKWAGSSYSIFVDLCAPGDNVLTTWADNNYSGTWGTSFASPQVAAAAALVDEYYGDTLNPWQITAILKNTAYNIDTIGNNYQYAGQLGKGLVNLPAAYTQTFKPGIFAENIRIKSSNTDTTAFTSNDTMLIALTISNYLAPTSNLYLKITSNNQYLDFISDSLYIGTLNTYQQIQTNYIFRAVVNENCPYESIADIKFTFIDTSKEYEEHYYKRVILNPSYLNIYPNNIATTITAYGRNGFNTFSQAQGIGFLYKNYSESLFYESGYIIGTREKICDAVRGQNDFYALQKADSIPSELTPYHYYSMFDDANGDTNKLGFRFIQDVYAFDNLPNSLLFKLTIINDTIISYDSLFFGVFTDWDIIDYSLNFADYDANRKIAYTYYNADDNVYAGVKFINVNQTHCYSFDNIQGAQNQIILIDGFDKNEKYQSLISDRYHAGSDSGNDVAQTISTGPYHFEEGDTITLWFAYLASNSKEELDSEADSIQTMYDNLFNSNSNPIIGNSNISIYPNPATNFLIIKSNQEVNTEIYDSQGKLLKQTTNKIIDIYGIPPQNLLLKIKPKGSNYYKIFKVVKK
jgi:serine protease